jgi:hypothetical protein
MCLCQEKPDLLLSPCASVSRTFALRPSFRHERPTMLTHAEEIDLRVGEAA